MMTPSSLKFTDRLVFRQVRLVLLLGLVVGAVLSVVQLYTVMLDERQRARQELEMIIQAVTGSAAQAAYNLDTSQAQEVVEALLSHSDIQAARVTNEFGTDIAAVSARMRHRYPLWLERLTFGEDADYSTSLTYGADNLRVGELHIETCGDKRLGAYLKYSWKLILYELARYVLLALLLGGLFYYAFGRTFRQLAEQVAALKPDSGVLPQVHIPRAHRKDEIGAMIRHINTVFGLFKENIERRKTLERELLLLNEELEERVQERTHELEIQTQSLAKEIEERKAAQEGLTEQHAFLNTIFHEIGAGILVFDPEAGAVTDANDVALEMLGVSLEDLRHEREKAVSLEYRTDAGYENLLTPDIRGPAFTEGVMRTADEDLIPVARHVVEVSLFGHLHIVQILFDITEIKNMERQLGIAQRLESIGLLAAGIAHEINTPIQYVGDSIQFLLDAYEELDGFLNAYDGACSAVIEGGDPKAQIQAMRELAEEADLDFLREEIPRACERALDGVQRVSTIVLAMKNFSHTGQEDMKTVDLNEALKTTIAVAKNEWKYVAEVDTDYDAELPLVQCLPGDVNQVFLNIVVNAAHAIKDKGPDSCDLGRITVRTVREEEHAAISIADTGTGIPPENVDKVFDPFFTTKEVGKGTGQGLAIAHDIIVNKHGGTIEVDSVPGEGTTFTIRLPFINKRQGENHDTEHPVC